MELKFSVLFSVLLHIFIFFPLYVYDKNEFFQMKFHSGSTRNEFFSFHITGNSQPRIQNKNQSNNAIEEGKISKEIMRLKNKISYPPLALEQKLESECEWTVTVGNLHKPDKIIETSKCRFPIFSRHVARFLVSWEFDLPPGTQIQIPVSFKLKNTH